MQQCSDISMKYANKIVHIERFTCSMSNVFQIWRQSDFRPVLKLEGSYGAGRTTLLSIGSEYSFTVAESAVTAISKYDLLT